MTIETQADVEALKTIGKIVAETLKLMMTEAKPGMTTKELDEIGKKYLEIHQAKSAPKHCYNFPGTTCISINEDIAHGIPNDYVIKDGDMINIDVSAELNGYFADTGGSFVVGPEIKKEQALVLKATKEALQNAMRVAIANAPLNLIGREIEKVAKKYNLKIIENLGSHGVGRALHEEPGFIAPFFDPKDKRKLKLGQVITIEPFLSTHSTEALECSDGWTLTTDKGNFAAQFEHSMIITKKYPIVLTQA